MEGKFSQALARVEDCLQQGKIIGVSSDWLLIMAYDRADIMVKMNHPEALEAARDALQICEEKSHTMTANCLLAVARAHLCENNFGQAFESAQKSLAASQEKKAMLEKLRALLVMGRALFELDRIPEAQKCLDQAQSLLATMGTTPRAITAIWEKELREQLSNAH
jgi:tetratricopeptide (TPR) repeat protein